MLSVSNDSVIIKKSNSENSNSIYLAIVFEMPNLYITSQLFTCNVVVDVLSLLFSKLGLFVISTICNLLVYIDVLIVASVSALSRVRV